MQYHFLQKLTKVLEQTGGFHCIPKLRQWQNAISVFVHTEEDIL